MEPQALYVQLGRLVESMPDLYNISWPISQEIHQWTGRAAALITEVGDAHDVRDFKEAVRHFLGPERMPAEYAVPQMIALVHRALATAELRAPVASQGAFIPAGNAFDAMAAIGKVLRTATRDLLIVDPYMDERTLTDFAPLAAEVVTIRLLADQQDHKPTLHPAQQRWATQYGATRPLEVRLAPARALHDRLIVVDNIQAWILTQSLNAFAARAPASIVQVDSESSDMKVKAYAAIWTSGTPL
jgi:hypothetical protein